MRFDNATSDLTALTFFTDGMLINQILQDPLLSSYSVVMVDDIHERTINTDLLLGLLKKIRRRRRDLKLVISSATLDAEQISAFFEEQELHSTVLSVEGRCFPVDVFYLGQPCKNYVIAALKIALALHSEKKPDSGDILVFLTS